MSEISEVEIESMTKEQNYMRGYKDGKFDVLNKIKADLLDAVGRGGSQQGIFFGLLKAAKIIDKYKTENEDRA